MPDTLAHWFAGGALLWRGPGASPLWTQIAPDLVTGFAFYAIAVALMVVFRRRAGFRFRRMLRLFSLLFFACGSAHLAMAAIGAWYPGSRLGVWFDSAAALVSVAIALLFWKKLPRILQLPDLMHLRELVARLEHEIAERSHVEEALRRSQETLRELAAYQERIREDERKRIAREIHDELGQTLLALRLDVSMLHARAGRQHPHLRQRAELALDYIDTTLKSIRAIINNLRPSVLDLGLPAAIEWQVRQFERRGGIPCRLTIRDDGWQVDDEHATAVFRILQESLTNVGRHACATAVQVELGVTNRLLTMTIRDNGIGMYPGDRRKARHFGLIGIQERAAMLGGELTIESSPGQGTTLRLSMPLQAREPAEVA